MATGGIWIKNAQDAWEEFPVGTDGQALVADSTATFGVEWGNSGDIQTARKTITFSSTSGEQTWFNVTGEVLVRFIVGFCTTDLVGGTSISLGVTNSTSLFIGATTTTAIDTNEIWVSTTPTADGIAVPAACKDIAIEENIVSALVGTITSGVIEVTCMWMPISSDGAVAAA